MVAAAAVVALNFTLTARADEPLLSPRAQGNQIHYVSGTNNEPNLLANRPMGKASQNVAKVSGTNNDVDLAHGPRPTMSPKDPRYEMAVKQLRDQQFQVAPVK